MPIIHPSHYPIEYIAGGVTFFGREYTVTPSVLIPRLETESLVRRARQILQSRKDESSKLGVRGEVTVGTENKKSTSMGEAKNEGVGLPIETFDTFGHKSILNSPIQKNKVIDIGSGSGIIGTSLADLADEVIFLDLSVDALRVAETNFRTHFPDKKAQFIASDLLSHLPELERESNILFVTNLPYIRQDDWEHMSADTVHEPKMALFGGEKTGFELYERLFEELSSWDNNTDHHWQCLFEFGYDQREVAESILKKYPQWEYSFFRDYSGVERFGEIKGMH